MKKLLAIFILVLSPLVYGSSKKYFEKKTHYQTFFGQCPSKVVGRLTLTLIKEFEKKNSLLDIKKSIVEQKLHDKYYLSSYNIKYDPQKNLIKFYYDCPLPLAKVQIYKKDGEEYYTAILVDSGKLYDPTYEVLLRSDKILKGDLPNLAIPEKLVNTKIYKKLAGLMNVQKNNFVKNISEIIINEKKELTVILSIGTKPSSAFLGKDYWGEKVEKLSEIVNYMSKKKTIPSVINLTNSKKVVVKFSDNI